MQEIFSSPDDMIKISGWGDDVYVEDFQSVYEDGEYTETIVIFRKGGIKYRLRSKMSINWCIEAAMGVHFGDAVVEVMCDNSPTGGGLYG